MRSAVLLCVVAACVSPDYERCAVRCVADCPSGLDCVAGFCQRSGEPSCTQADAPPPGPDGPSCPNGTVDPAEQCDDGNGSDSDGCLSDCTWAKCGDGKIRTGVEECDDGDNNNGDGCSSVCLACSGAGEVEWGENGHCYSWLTDLDWPTALGACKKGAHIATLTRSDEDAFVVSLAGGDPLFWIGLTDIGQNLTYHWITGEPLTYNDWSSGEPTGEDCVWSDGESWHDDPCLGTRDSICEDDGWILRPADNHAYRVIHQDLMYSEAIGACDELGAHLVTLASIEEEGFLATHIAGIDNVAGLSDVWLGLHDMNVEGSFEWLTGEPVAYTAWGVGQPNGGTSDNCAEWDVDDGWSDEECDSTNAVVCEID